MTENHSKFFHFVRDGIFVILLGVVLLSLIEVSIRVLLPQDERIQLLNGLTIGKRDSVLGHVNQPNANVKVKCPEYEVEYVVSAEGFRDRTIHTVPKPPDVFRILLLGDSFTWGTGVEYANTWPVIFEELCRQQRPNIDVVKAGVSGYDTRQEVLYLQRLLPLYEPDVAAIVFLPNDLVTNLPIAENDSQSRSEILQQDSLVALRQQDKSSELQTATLIKRFMISNDFIYEKLYSMTGRTTYFTTPVSKKLKEQIATTEHILSTAAAYCRSHNVRFMVFSIPQLFQIIAETETRPHGNVDTHFIDREFSRFAESQNFPWIETLPTLSAYYRNTRNDIYFRFDGHLNETGHRLAGEYFSRQFTELVMSSTH